MVDSEDDNQQAGSSEKKDPSDNDVSSFRRHSMGYVDPKQIASETGYTDKKDWYLLILKELFDNAIDFLQTYYKGSKNEKITVRIAIDATKSLFHYKFTNTNSKYPSL